jgi:hypothetical protein
MTTTVASVPATATQNDSHASRVKGTRRCNVCSATT